jgi:CBS domain-containing protein
MDAQEEVARLFGKYNLVTAPVLDPDNRLVGVITVDGVVDVIAEEADEEIKALGGITSDEERSDSIWTIARGRFNWLLVNLATAFLAASVLGLFKGQFEKMVALAVLAPIVASQGGNAATQTMTVAVRAPATRELGANKAWRVVLRESMVRPCQRLGLRAHHRCRGGCVVQCAQGPRRDRARDRLQSGRRRVGRHPDSDRAGTAADRSRRRLRHLRHDRDRRRRLLPSSASRRSGSA